VFIHAKLVVVIYCPWHIVASSVGVHASDFESGVGDFRWEAGTRHMVGPSLVDMGEYGGLRGEYHGSFHVDIHLVEVHASEFIPVSVTFVGTRKVECGG
jgi:hypothetical protein